MKHIPLEVAHLAPRVERMDPLVYRAPALRNGAVGWWPEGSKVRCDSTREWFLKTKFETCFPLRSMDASPPTAFEQVFIYSCAAQPASFIRTDTCVLRHVSYVRTDPLFSARLCRCGTSTASRESRRDGSPAEIHCVTDRRLGVVP